MGSVFGSVKDENPNEKLEVLQENLKECIDDKSQIEKKHISEIENLEGKLKSLQVEYNTKGRQLEILANKIVKRQKRIIGLKKVIEEMTKKIASFDQKLTEANNEKSVLFQKLLKWERIENMNINTEKIQENIKKFNEK